MGVRACVRVCGCSTGAVPKDIKGKVRQMLLSDGPMMQSQFLPKWNKTFPDNQFDYAGWGFERLTGALESLPDLVVITKDGAKKSYLSLKGGAPPPVGAAADGAAGKGAGISRDAMAGVVAGVIGSKANVDPAQVQAFMKQPKLQFTIDCLVAEFAKFSAAGVSHVHALHVKRHHHIIHPNIRPPARTPTRTRARTYAV